MKRESAPARSERGKQPEGRPISDYKFLYEISKALVAETDLEKLLRFAMDRLIE